MGKLKEEEEEEEEEGGGGGGGGGGGEGEVEGEGAGRRGGMARDRIPEDGMRSDGETSDRADEESFSPQVRPHIADKTVVKKMPKPDNVRVRVSATFEVYFTFCEKKTDDIIFVMKGSN